LGVVVERPAKEGEEVQYRFGQITGSAVLEHALGAVPLGELRAVLAEDQRDVKNRRHLVAEGLEQQLVPGRRGEPLLTADHMRNRHRVVVDGHGEVIGREAVRLEDDEVIEESVLKADLAPQVVVKYRLTLVRHPETHDRRSAVRLRFRLSAAFGSAAAAV